MERITGLGRRGKEIVRSPLLFFIFFHFQIYLKGGGCLDLQEFGW